MSARLYSETEDIGGPSYQRLSQASNDDSDCRQIWRLSFARMIGHLTRLPRAQVQTCRPRLGPISGL